jgi:hypothetical protein
MATSQLKAIENFAVMHYLERSCIHCMRIAQQKLNLSYLDYKFIWDVENLTCKWLVTACVLDFFGHVIAQGWIAGILQSFTILLPWWNSYLPMSSRSWFLLDTCILAEKVAPCFIPVLTDEMGQSTTLCHYRIHLVWCHMNRGHQILYRGLQLFSKWKRLWTSAPVWNYSDSWSAHEA